MTHTRHALDTHLTHTPDADACRCLQQGVYKLHALEHARHALEHARTQGDIPKLTLHAPQLSQVNCASTGGVGSSSLSGVGSSVSCAQSNAHVVATLHTADAVGKAGVGSQDAKWPLSAESQLLQKRRVKRQATWLVSPQGKGRVVAPGVSVRQRDGDKGARGESARGQGHGGFAGEDVEGSASRFGGNRRARAGTSSGNTHACASVSPAVSSCVPTTTAPNEPRHAARASLSPATSPSCVPGSEWGRGDECASHAQGVSVERERGGKRKMHELQDGSGTRERLERNKRAGCVVRGDGQAAGQGESDAKTRAMLTLGRRVEVQISDGMEYEGAGGAWGNVCVGVITQRLADGKFRVRDLNSERDLYVWNRISSCLV